MVDNKYDIVGIGNSIVDVITDVEDQFLNEHELRKGLMSLVDLDGIKNISGKIDIKKTVSGGSVANSIAAQALIDSVVRNLPGVLGNNLSTVDESFSDGLLEYPQYTKPSVWNGKKVPAVLLSGNHNKVRDWKRKKSRELTKNRRPDLLSKLKKNP